MKLDNIICLFRSSKFHLFSFLFFYNNTFGQRTILVLVNSVELIAVKTALLTKETYGLQYTFVIPAIAIFCSAVWAFLFMPETHGRTLKEIGSIYAEKGNEAKVSSLKFLLFSSLNEMILSIN